MAKRQGAFADLLEVSSKLPWQVGVGLAVVSGLIFHFAAVASAVLPKVTNAGQLGFVVVQQGIHTFASFLQFIVPAALLIGATASVIARSRSGALIEATKANPTPSLKSMRWRDFERLVGEAFRQQGYAVTGFGGRGPDGGMDLGLMKNGERFLVQCKHWRNRQVGVTVVRELNGVMAAQGAHGGFLVTGGQFTKEAREFAAKTKIELIDGDSLGELIGSAATPGPARVSASTSPPACPQCGTMMVKREAKHGKFVGKSFWGCAQYPKCSGIAQISRVDSAT
jgi:restriction system protein